MEPRVGFKCVAPAHQAGDGGADKLTVYEGQWAYCSFNARADAHEWRATEGATLTMLRAGTLARGKEQAKETGSP